MYNITTGAYITKTYNNCFNEYLLRRWILPKKGIGDVWVIKTVRLLCIT